jgi:hypothetical protein
MIGQLCNQRQTAPLDGIEAIVMRRLGNRVRDFRLLIVDDGIVLVGQAASYHAKQLAQHAVMKATSAPILANDIAVAEAN